ncbi:uncharacterized protein LOC118267138 [Spodoptera frugiperda]|uniref:Uncharacterized protein LOC118267138 n=1 Tax=Spodoptera frugiperda TaxID=7108 RepID=A0A9R0D1G0_SPOFR|nr:uncharacterized protein LOC118267138 [Spodoptera frugiperda]
MPRRRKSNLSRRTRAATKRRNVKKEFTDEELASAREKNRLSTARYRASRTQEEKEKAREKAKLAMRRRRAGRKDQQRLRSFSSDASSDILIPIDVCDNDILQRIETGSKVPTSKKIKDQEMTENDLRQAFEELKCKNLANNHTKYFITSERATYLIYINKF